MFDDAIINEMMGIFGQGLRFGLLIGFPAFFVTLGFGTVVRLFKNISK